MLEYEYLSLMERVITQGTMRPNRTGINAASIFHANLSHDLAMGLPLLTTKEVHWHSVLTELLWFIRGDSDIDFLKKHNVRIWDEWAHPDTLSVGPMYGHQWRHWGGDQLSKVIEGIKHDPYGRRHVVSSWNPNDLYDMVLCPCHVLFQFYVNNDRLSISIYQRSADVFLGLPFNLASYATLCRMVGTLCNLKPGILYWTGGDVHVYENHMDQARQQLARNPRRLPTLIIRDWGQKTIDDFTHDDFALFNYDPHPKIPAKVAV